MTALASAPIRAARRPNPSLVRGARPAPDSALPFYLFLVVNATLFVRPAEVVPGLIGWPIYQVLILACLFLSLPCVLAQLTPASLGLRPITVCVLALLPVVFLSRLGNGDLLGAVDSGLEFFKVVVYYLLFVGLVNSPARLRQFLLCFTLFTVVMVILAVLNYQGVITLANLGPLQDQQREALTGRDVVFARLRSTGIFNDPNELCLILVLGMALCSYWAGERRFLALRFLWLLPLALFGCALALTQSRGGFLALLIGMLVFFYVRFGKVKSIALIALALPVLFWMFAGRQTHVSIAEQTAHERIQLWSDGLLLFRQNPVLGIGQDQFSKAAGLVGHNSFLHCFTELGFLGGTLFLGAFYFCLRELHRLGSAGNVIIDPELRRLYSYLTAGIAGYVGGMLSVSYSYAVPTYTVLGLGSAYLGMTRVFPPLSLPRFDGRLVGRFVMISVLFLIGLQIFVRFYK